jgi:hypothetical protein
MCFTPGFVCFGAVCSLAPALKHDPEKWIQFSGKIMLKQQAKAECPTSSHFALACPFMTWSASVRDDAGENNAGAMLPWLDRRR